MRDVEHFSPETLDEAAALLLAAGSQAHPIAAGTDLIAEVGEGQRRLSLVLDLRRIRELNRLDYDERNGLRVGAAVPFTTILEFAPVRHIYPMLADGSPPVVPGGGADRSTLGGNLSPGTPTEDLAPPLICLRASVAIFGPHGWSEVAVEALFAETGRAALQPAEFVVDVRFPAPPPRSNGAYIRAVPTGREGAAGGVGAFVAMEQDLSTCCGARLTLSGVARTPLRALKAERFLAGKPLESAVLQEAGDLAAQSAGSVTGLTGHRLAVMKDLTCRAILQALARVRTGART